MTTSLPPYWTVNKHGKTTLANPHGLFSGGHTDDPNQPRWSSSLPETPTGFTNFFVGGGDPTDKVMFDPVRQKHLQEEVLHQQRQLAMTCELVTRLSADCEHLQRCVIQLDQRLIESNNQIAELKSRKTTNAAAPPPTASAKLEATVAESAQTSDAQKKQKRDE
jgi:hypothetical protein